VLPMRKHGLRERERPTCRRTSSKKVGGGHPLDRDPPMSGKRRGDDTPSLFLPAHNSPPTSWCCLPIGGGHGQRTSIEALPGRERAIDRLAWVVPPYAGNF
jgi:hypothetical protein